MTLAERFERMFIPEPNTGCWLWMGAVDPRGYGRFGRTTGRAELAHRISYEMHYGCAPAGLFVCHKCDMPPCVNPEHLFLGTHADNVEDMLIKGRQIRGEKSRNAKLTAAQVRKIREMPQSQRKIATIFGISQGQAWRIKSGKSWKHLLNERGE